MNRTTRIAHLISVVLMGAGVLIATADGFVQSYAGLYHWAIERGLTGWKAETFPLLVDLFIIVGELGLFALALEGHRLRKNAMSWADIALPFGLAAGGWAVSLAFNVGAVDGGTDEQVTAAVAPVASMLGLLVLLRTVHRLVTRTPDDDSQMTAWPLPHLDGQAAARNEAPALADAPAAELPPGAPVLAAVPDPAAVPEDTAPGPGAVPEDVLDKARTVFADELQAGRVPGLRPIKNRLRVGQPRAGEVQAYLKTLIAK